MVGKVILSPTTISLYYVDTLKTEPKKETLEIYNTHHLKTVLELILAFSCGRLKSCFWQV